MLLSLNLFLQNWRWVETSQTLSKVWACSVAITINQGWSNAAQKYCCWLMEKYKTSELSFFGLGANWLPVSGVVRPCDFSSTIVLTCLTPFLMVRAVLYCCWQCRSSWVLSTWHGWEPLLLLAATVYDILCYSTHPTHLQSIVTSQE